MICKKPGLADIGCEDIGGAVSGDVLEPEETGPGPGGTLDHAGDSAVADRACAGLTTHHVAEHGSVRDSGSLQPGLEQGDGPDAAPFGIGIGRAEAHGHAFWGAVELVAAQPGQFRPPEGPGHAEGQQRPVTDGLQVCRRHGGQHGLQHPVIGGLLAARGGAGLTADAGDHFGQHARLWLGLGRHAAGLAMGKGDGRQPAADR